MQSVEFFPSERLTEIVPQWHDLAQNSLEPNPYYLPEFAQHALEGSSTAGKTGAIVVSDPRRDGLGSLIGLWPFHFPLPDAPAMPGLVVGLHNAFMASTIPLVRSNCEQAALGGFLDWLEVAAGRFGALNLDELRLDGPIWMQLKAVLEQRRQSWCVIDEYDRPLVDSRSASSQPAYLKRLSGKKRQSLKRKWRRLSENGELTYTRHVGPELCAAMDDFLELERAGWKGAAGTAMALSDSTQSLACDVLCSPQYGATRIEALRLNGRPIAMSIHLSIGGQAYFFKPAYDEALAPFSPGQLLHFKTIEGLYQERWATSIDSAAEEDDQLGAIWVDRRRVGRVLIATSRTMPAQFLDATAYAVRSYANARSTALKTFRNVRRRLHPSPQLGAR